LLWFDHELLVGGEAFTNHDSNFYKVGDTFNDYYSWGAPFKQFVSDCSLSITGSASNGGLGAQVPTGIYTNGSFTTTGNYVDGVNTSPLLGFNYSDGHAYLNAEQAESMVISGRYAVKDFSVYLTNKAEQELLFETKIDIRPSTTQTPTGLPANVSTYPAIFIKNNGGRNQPFSLGGEELTSVSLRAVVIADSQFKADAVCSIFKDTARRVIPVFDDHQYPFDALGGFKSGVPFDYDNLSTNATKNVYINDVGISRFSLGYMENFANSNPDIFRALIDFELVTYRYPRLNLD
jgi:hypothetical protein